jgi:hypothetical protein
MRILNIANVISYAFSIGILNYNARHGRLNKYPSKSLSPFKLEQSAATTYLRIPAGY